MIWLFPVGLYFSIRELRDEHVFIIIYGILGSYFAGVMVRLMLTLTPVICVAAALALSTILDVYGDFSEFFHVTTTDESDSDSTSPAPVTPETSAAAPPAKKTLRTLPYLITFTQTLDLSSLLLPNFLFWAHLSDTSLCLFSTVLGSLPTPTLHHPSCLLPTSPMDPCFD